LNLPPEPSISKRIHQKIWHRYLPAQHFSYLRIHKKKTSNKTQQEATNSLFIKATSLSREKDLLINKYGKRRFIFSR
jgi:hypothetical protein